MRKLKKTKISKKMPVNKRRHCLLLKLKYSKKHPIVEDQIIDS